MITAALNGDLNTVEYITHKIFVISIPLSWPNVPDNILDPRNTWENKNHYDTKANELAKAFNKNFTQFSSNANKDILEAAPKTSIEI